MIVRLADLALRIFKDTFACPLFSVRGTTGAQNGIDSNRGQKRACQKAESGSLAYLGPINGPLHSYYAQLPSLFRVLLKAA